VIREHLAGAAPEAIANLAFRIQELNDWRNELVKEINAVVGVVREEKL